VTRKLLAAPHGSPRVVLEPRNAGRARPPSADASLVAAQRRLLFAATDEDRAAAVAALSADAHPWVARTLLAS
jgi:hypothetical protein